MFPRSYTRVKVSWWRGHIKHILIPGHRKIAVMPTQGLSGQKTWSHGIQNLHSGFLHSTSTGPKCELSISQTHLSVTGSVALFKHPPPPCKALWNPIPLKVQACFHSQDALYRSPSKAHSTAFGLLSAFPICSAPCFPLCILKTTLQEWDWWPLMPPGFQRQHRGMEGKRLVAMGWGWARKFLCQCPL